MRERVKLVVLTMVCLLTASLARAQVGHPPASSPYLDLDYKQELTLFGGYVRTRHDPAGIAPKSFPTLGVGYEITLVGPLALSANVFGGSTKRDVLDPVKPFVTRPQGQQTSTELGGDVSVG